MSEERELLAQIMRYFAAGDIAVKEFEMSSDIAETLHNAQELLAQPEQTEQTPVAWMYDYISPTSVKHTSVEFGKCPSEEWMTNIRPLYTSPPTRKALSDDEIRVGMGDEPPISRSGFVRGVKFAEKAHGIGGDDA